MVCFKVWQKAHLYGVSTLTRSAVLSLLLRDSFIWFCAATILMFTNMFAFLYAGNVYNYMGVPILQSALCIGGCRLMLNVRNSYSDEGKQQRAAKQRERRYRDTLKNQYPMETSFDEESGCGSIHMATTRGSIPKLDDDIMDSEETAVDMQAAWYGEPEMPHDIIVDVREEGGLVTATLPGLPCAPLQIQVEVEVEVEKPGEGSEEDALP